LRAKVLKLEKKLFDGKAARVVLPAANGEMCILPNHMSIITSLKKGSIRIFKTDSECPTIIEIDGGICSFFNNEAVFILN
jgi:F-type H+-transporting ATPase subunit epsilon